MQAEKVKLYYQLKMQHYKIVQDYSQEAVLGLCQGVVVDYNLKTVDYFGNDIIKEIENIEFTFNLGTKSPNILQFNDENMSQKQNIQKQKEQEYINNNQQNQNCLNIQHQFDKSQGQKMNLSNIQEQSYEKSTINMFPQYYIQDRNQSQNKINEITNLDLQNFNQKSLLNQNDFDERQEEQEERETNNNLTMTPETTSRVLQSKNLLQKEVFFNDILSNRIQSQDDINQFKNKNQNLIKEKIIQKGSSFHKNILNDNDSSLEQSVIEVGEEDMQQTNRQIYINNSNSYNQKNQLEIEIDSQIRLNQQNMGQNQSSNRGNKNMFPELDFNFQPLNEKKNQFEQGMNVEQNCFTLNENQINKENLKFQKKENNENINNQKNSENESKNNLSPNKKKEINTNNINKTNKVIQNQKLLNTSGNKKCEEYLNKQTISSVVNCSNDGSQDFMQGQKTVKLIEFFQYYFETFLGQGLKFPRLLQNLIKLQNKAKASYDSEFFKILRLLSSVSHELRTPLSGITNNLDCLYNNECINVGIKKQYIFPAQCSSKLLNSTISDIIDYANMHISEFKLEVHRFSVEQLLNEIILLYTPLISEKNMNFFCDLDPEIPEQFYSDYNRLKQVLINLVTNAFKFSYEGNIKITAKMSKNKDYLKFIVDDGGVGMNQENLQYYTNQFKKIGKNGQKILQDSLQVSTTSNRGAGIGLLFCALVVNGLSIGKQVKIQSKENEGTKISFKVFNHIQNIKTGSNKNVNKDKSQVIQKNELWISNVIEMFQNTQSQLNLKENQQQLKQQQQINQSRSKTNSVSHIGSNRYKNQNYQQANGKLGSQIRIQQATSGMELDIRNSENIMNSYNEFDFNLRNNMPQHLSFNIDCR
ncbi:Signal transduction histidine kinase, homodimeric domain [Pseudocohnilembus persalinus]|uniref:histidine kinase n=1 Tax=Pseudocohnilembus persalinus TaxID=266149 RepID=A0A0V0QXZ1_PSEPJ|nr:Signal transduction histidine kinase, homodimeric domain [Pseudocohnilembus persalinus]|eukprot:KRX07225.1 Signal transduction histidine kinase, homodimeric domain [Pseudocohnilembus persalinus]